MHALDPAFRSLSCGQALAMVFVVASGVAGCVTAQDSHGARPAPSPVTDNIREIDLSARFPQRPVGNVAGGGLRDETYYGDGSPSMAGKRRGNQGNDWDNGPLTTGA